MLKQKLPKLDSDAIWYVCRYVRWAQDSIKKYGDTTIWEKECVKPYIEAMTNHGIKIDRNRIYETNYLSELIRDYIKEN